VQFPSRVVKSPAPQGQAPTGPQDASGGGGGNIGTGSAPAPGEQGFTGTQQQ